jgi:translation initiation factor 1 (eIF-1/SUI1)
MMENTNSSKMDDRILTTNIEATVQQANILAMIDRKVVIKEKIEKGKKKTYVIGLELIDDLNTTKRLKEFTKKLKTNFGCGCQLTKDDNKKDLLILQGSHKEKITIYIKSKYPSVQIT